MRSVEEPMIRMCSIVIIAVISVCHAYAQTSLNDVHVDSRSRSAEPDDLRSLAGNTTGLIRTKVDLVVVPVTVMDSAHRIVTGLGPENFHLYEDKRPQSIKDFWSEDEPVSVGILLDVSGSMGTKMDRARDSVTALLSASNPQDEFFLMTFADQPLLVQDFTQDTNAVQKELVFANAKGQTSLLDAIVFAMNNMKKARYRRKALVIISDGGDNRSRYTEKNVKSLVKEEDVLVYSIGVFGAELQTREEQLGPELLAEISELTGASAYTLDNPDYLCRIAEHIARELRYQYMVTYSPDSARRKGKWRKIKVSLALPHGIPELHVQARTGYYGSEE